MFMEFYVTTSKLCSTIFSDIPRTMFLFVRIPFYGPFSIEDGYFIAAVHGLLKHTLMDMIILLEYECIFFQFCTVRVTRFYYIIIIVIIIIPKAYISSVRKLTTKESNQISNTCVNNNRFDAVRFCFSFFFFCWFSISNFSAMLVL